VYGFCGDNASQGCGLALPTWTQGQIDLSLEASLSIPDGFPMPDQEEPHDYLSLASAMRNRALSPE
jgi:hypothetical protein